ncbi:myb-like HTH transcriptional regulator family protein [Artemisia annua]|uniref:Myb-like HTH transcriptional regulator family protein n=1 Tax=Artemisia annua TaxID=35608 RepID=A0A2U1QCI6_ARTAN|nr:myb-like HTH transcriptional regulator family protein [Artemisia annua]
MERVRMYDDLGEIKKGPWKAEEDEVLLKHVRKYGPRDWSSIRSKGLLQRTGKSCRLRWVNKLRPDLKNGVKFSADEERVVIELQGEFGNKWARIATYLPGRTDNDVKNFWSSRQKRLARVLQTPTPPPAPKSKKSVSGSPALLKVPALEAPKRSSSTDGESSVTSPKTLSCSSSYREPIKMVPLPDLMNSTGPTSLLSYDQNQPLCQLNYSTIPVEEKSSNMPPDHPLLQDFPHVPQVELPPPLPTLPPLLDSQDIFSQLADPYFYAVFGPGGSSEIVEFPYMPPGGEGGESGGSCGRHQNDDPMVMAPDMFMDDFPVDMFDNIEPLPSPSDW